MSLFKKLFTSKNEAIKTNTDFWNWFVQNEKLFYNVVKKQGDVNKLFFDKISPKLDELKKGYFFLTGMKDDNTAELILTADGNINNIAFVEDLVKDAPKLKGWLFTALKPEMDSNDFGIKMNNYNFDSKNIHFYANNSNDYPDEIDITIVHDDYNEKNKEEIINGFYIFLDNYIGELNSVTIIDNIIFKSKSEINEELVPVSKLKDFLTWREKEFLEKYEGERHNTENDKYHLMQAKLENGNGLVAVMNTDLLNWDRKASHPWICELLLKFDDDFNGMPTENTSELLNKIEDGILIKLKDVDGYLNIGRETFDNKRFIYFACKDFRKPSKILYKLSNKKNAVLNISYNIYKDKYWQSFNRFINN